MNKIICTLLLLSNIFFTVSAYSGQSTCDIKIDDKYSSITGLSAIGTHTYHLHNESKEPVEFAIKAAVGFGTASLPHYEENRVVKLYGGQDTDITIYTKIAYNYTGTVILMADWGQCYINDQWKSATHPEKNHSNTIVKNIYHSLPIDGMEA